MSEAHSSGDIPDLAPARRSHGPGLMAHRGELACATRPQAQSIAYLGSSSLLALTLVAIGVPTPAHAVCAGPGPYGASFLMGLVNCYPGGSVQEITAGGPTGGINETVPGAVSGTQTGIVAINANDGATHLIANGSAIGVINYGYGILAVNSDKVTFNTNGTLTSVSTTSTATDLSVQANGHVFGGNSGIYAQNEGTGATVVTATDEVSSTNAAINVLNGANTTGLTVQSGALNGSYGVSAVNNGQGDTSITTNGLIEAMVVGISASNNGDNGHDLTVQANAGVNSGFIGISASNFGTGATRVTTRDAVESYGFSGIVATNGATATDLTVQADVKVSGGDMGIWAENRGLGETRVTATGGAQGTYGYGLVATNGHIAYDNPNTAITKVDGANGNGLGVDAGGVSGGKTGIFAVNTGAGVTSVKATGDVAGTQTYGIMAINADQVTFNADGTVDSLSANSTASSLMVQADGGVSGGVTGIYAYNRGNGITYVNAGTVTGTGAFGIEATGWGTATIVSAGAVSGGLYGIAASNFGNGPTLVQATGTVTAGATGIDVYGGIQTTLMGVNAAAVSGGTYGIHAINRGTGATQIAATGDVTASFDPTSPGTGILAYAGQTTVGGLSIAAKNVSGAIGISANNSGTGVTQVTAQNVTGIYGIVVGNGVVDPSDVGGDNPLAMVGGHDNPNATDIVVKTGAVTASADGSIGVVVFNHGTGKTEVTTTGDVTSGFFGIYAVNQNSNTTDLTINTVGVTGRTGGIVAANTGTGRTSITATGDVTGSLDPTNPNTGILAYAGQTTVGGLSIAAKNVSGAIGISANNSGTGVTQVTAQNVTGIYGVVVGNGVVDPSDVGGDNPLAMVGGHDNPNATDIVVKTGAVTASADGSIGVVVFNHGTGKTEVTTTGDVTSGLFGIYAGNQSPNTTDLTINTVGVTGGAGGILAANTGTGRTSITATGDVTASPSSEYAGIFAYAGQTTTGGLSIDAKNVSGSVGIAANNSGAGATQVTAQNVTGVTYGVVVGNGVVDPSDVGGNPLSLAGGNSNPNATDLLVKTGAVTVSGDGSVGIFALNQGIGKTSVTATGNVTAENSGVLAGNFSGTDLTVTTAGVSGGITGIATVNYGTGKTSVTATGTVTGGSGVGILAGNFSGTDLTVTAADVSGGTYGISATNAGAGKTGVAVSGAVQGGTAGIYVDGIAPATVTIAATGAVRNASGLASDLAMQATGASLLVANAGQLTGRVLFDGNATLNNSGTWLTSGASDFGAGNDKLVNAGTIRATGATRFDNLETFTSSGVVTMQNGTAGNRIATPAKVTLAAGSTLGVDINAAGAADGIDTTGTANISGATLNVAAQGVRAGRYTIVTATGGLNGTFAAVTGAPVSAFAGVVDTYDADDAYLDVLRVRDFADAGLTRNQKAAAAGIQSTSGNDPLFAGSSLYNAVMALPTDAAARAAFDLASGEVHASAKTALIDDSRFVRNAAIDRIRSAFGTIGATRSPAMAYAGEDDVRNAMAYAGPTKAPPFAPAQAVTAGPVLWGQGFGSWGHVASDGNAARLSHETGGVITGGDMAVADTWRVGLMGGYSRTSFNVNDRASSGISDNYHVGVYGGTQAGPLGLRLGATYTWHDITTNRAVVFPGFADQLRGDYNAGTTQVFGEIGYGIRAGNFGFEPFINAAYVNLHTDGFAEKGGAAALRGDGDNAVVTFTTLGLHASSEVMLGSVAATARGTLGWRHAFGDTLPLATLSLAGGLPFTVAGVPIAPDAAVVDAGLDFAIARNATIGVVYGGQFGNRATDQSIKGNLAIRF